MVPGDPEFVNHAICKQTSNQTNFNVIFFFFSFSQLTEREVSIRKQMRIAKVPMRMGRKWAKPEVMDITQCHVECKKHLEKPCAKLAELILVKNRNQKA